MKPRTLQMASLRHGHRVRLADGRWGAVTGRSVVKADHHSRGTVTKLPDRVWLWVLVDGTGETVKVDNLATDRMEVGDIYPANSPRACVACGGPAGSDPSRCADAFCGANALLREQAVKGGGD